MLVLSRQTELHLISLDVSYFANVIVPVSGEGQNIVAADVDINTGRTQNFTLYQLTVAIINVNLAFLCM
jgi:hypothetical protein